MPRTSSPEPAPQGSKALRAFDHYAQARQWSAATRRKYRYELVCFAVDYLIDHDLALLAASEADVLDYVASLPAHGSKRGDATRALKAFYGWAHTRHRDDDPSAALKIPRAKLTTAPTLSDDAARQLVDAANARELRRGAAITLALETGARVSSLVEIRAADLHVEPIEEAFVEIRVAKGDRPYRLPLTQGARNAAVVLLALGHEPVLGVGAARFRQWVHEAERDAGLERVWPHLLRHHFARRVAESGDLEAWRRAMNHSDLSQWPRYVAEEGDERIRKALRRVED
jgi:site-specific recombinase XerD